MEYLSETVEAYEKYVVENIEHVGSVEKFLTAFQYIIPNRYSDNELQTEVYNCALKTIEMFHDYVWAAAAANVQGNGNNIEVSKRIFRALKKSKTLPKQSILLTTLFSLITNSEMLIELITIYMDKNKGTKYRWPTILSIEIVKTLIQIKMFFNAGGSILCHRHFPTRPTLFEPVREDNEIDLDEDEVSEDLQFEDIFSQINKKTGQRWTLAEARMIHKEKEKRKRESSTVPTQTTISVAFGELIWIFRPLIYLYALFKHGPKSWRPWIYSLLVDIASWRLQSSASHSFNSLELEELGRRRFLWVLYLVRAPGPLKIFFKWLTTSSFTKVPGVETAAFFIVNILQIIQQRYFYTAGSS